MGSLLYDFLAESFLFSESDLQADYRRWTDEQLKRELARYRDFVLHNLPVLSAEVTSSESNLRVFHPDQGTTVRLLRQTALYVEQFVICDPLFELTFQGSEIGSTMNRYLGYQQKGLDREKLIRAVGFLREVTPLVAGDFLKILPTSFFSEPPAQPPIYYSENNYEEGIPTPILEYFRKRATASSLERIGNGWATRGDLYPCRAISVTLPGYCGGRIYYLFEQEILSKRDVGNETLVEFRQHLPEEPPSKEQFEIWVNQSINRTSKSVLTEIVRDLDFASTHSAMLLTASEFKADLLNANFPIEHTIQSEVLNSLFELRLPFLDGISTESIMEVRVNDGQAFQNLRIELERQLRELRLVKDPEQLRLKKENLVHELSEVQVRQVDQKVRSLKRKAFADAALLVGGLVGSVQTGGWSLLASAIATAKGYQTVQEFLQNTRQNPAFFLWKVLQK